MISGLYADAFVEPPDAPTKLRARKAVMHDIPLILDLINAYAAKGIMLARTEFELSEAIRDFSVVRQGETLLGCGALHFYTPTIGEIRSLAVDEKAKTKGVGRVLVEALVDVWKTLELPFEEAKVVPLRRPGAEAAQCAYPQMKKAAE